MPAEKVTFKDKDITWLSFSEWADLPSGGRVRVGIAEVDRATPVLHIAGADKLDWFHVHGVVVMEEGVNDVGTPWIRVLYPTARAVLTPVGDVSKRAKDAYEAVAE